MSKLRLIGIVLSMSAAFVANASAAAINLVDYNSLTGSQVIVFSNLQVEYDPGKNYDDIITSGYTSFGERFSVQTIKYKNDDDILAIDNVSDKTVNSPLCLVRGNPGRNLVIMKYHGTNILIGLGNRGFPDFRASGEGSIAALFDEDQSQIGFQLVQGGEGTASIDFFRRDGSLIDSTTISPLVYNNDVYYGFSREGGARDIAGFSLYNDDPNGIGLGYLKCDAPKVPLPAAFFLFGSGLLSFIGLKKRIKE
jgi:hypothetical protein